MDKLQIQETAHDRTFSTYMVNGLSVAEMNRIFNPQDDDSRQDDRLAEILNKHNPGLGDIWRYGYGIYSIRHVGGHLLVQVGNSCD